MFGDEPFFGRSVWETPVSPPSYVAAPAPPNATYGGYYSYGANHSVFHNSGGSLTGYMEQPYYGLGYYDCGARIGNW